MGAAISHGERQGGSGQPTVRVLTAEFVCSASTLAQCPDEGLPELAVVGRSNVGKSSMINALLGRRKLARVSRTPGRTRLLNFFRVRVLATPALNHELMLCDLPGYGYAKAGRAETQAFQAMIEPYLSARRRLVATLALLDVRREPSALDVALFEWLSDKRRTIVPVVTKVDKVARSRQAAALRRIEKALKLPDHSAIGFSAVTGQGHDALWMRVLDLVGASAES
jgi:GTP-binding protein